MSIAPQREVARESGGGPFLYPQLMTTNYTNWVIRVQAMMEYQGVWEVVEPAAGAAVDEKKDKKARSHRFQALPEDLLMQVAREKIAKEEGESLYQYARRFNNMFVRYANQGETLDDAALVKKLFDIVPDRFLSIVVTATGVVVDAAEVVAEMVVAGCRRNKSHIKCFNCHKMGHYANECKAPKKKEEETHLTHADDIETALLLVVSEEPAQEQQHQRGAMLLNKEKVKSELRDTTEGGSSSEIWYLDNGASNHMTGVKEKFRELDESVTDKVKFVDGSTVQIMGIGSVVFSCKNDD
ncbi:uncharacterized protein LOC133902117 [Phragmites australis]|uniref:uncharacterized protein LOC133902117 n=1 Tax=Phragmites australis TaxID=29695 RepID=UPI002D76CF8E|nr:uncharacterized protein LOC133902117 [Phragmites australis]